MTENIENKSLYNIEHILAQMSKIQAQTEQLTNVIENLAKINDAASNTIVQGQYRLAVDIIRSRETTNQQLLSLYDKMYDDLKPSKSNK